MAADRPGGRDELRATQRASGAGRTLAASLPRLILESRKIAATVIHGLHGRRRAGSGENFWQFRRFVSGEEARRIDWRRSARDDNLYVREREWEAAHTIWIWPDRSPSMAFASRLGAGEQARPRAGHRVRAGRSAGRGRRARRPARPDAPDRQPRRDRPHGGSDHPRSDRAREPAARLCAGFAVGNRGAVRPVEPDRGHPRDPHAAFGQRLARPSRADRRSGRGNLPLFRPHRVHRARGRRRDHRRPRRELARRLRRAARRATATKSAPRRAGSAGASPSTAPTARPTNCCWRCTARIGEGNDGGQRPTAGRTACAWEVRHDGPAARLRAAAGAARPAQPAGAVVAAAAHSAAAAARSSFRRRGCCSTSSRRRTRRRARRGG